MIITIITFIIVFGILVLVREYGHYYFAKRAGILVREFSIGMGPKFGGNEKMVLPILFEFCPSVVMFV